MSDNAGTQIDQIKPVKLAHFVIRTTPEKFEEMAQWYLDLLNAKIAFKNAFSSFMTYDDEHHRAAVIAIPGLIPRPDNAVGVDHVAFTYGSLGDLLLNYERLAARGVEPVLPLHHGPTLSMYYQDPQKNQVELQVDAFETAEETEAEAQVVAQVVNNLRPAGHAESARCCIPCGSFAELAHALPLFF